MSISIVNRPTNIVKHFQCGSSFEELKILVSVSKLFRKLCERQLFKQTMRCYMVTYLVAKETQPSGANSPWDWRPQWGQELVCMWNKPLNAENLTAVMQFPMILLKRKPHGNTWEIFTEDFEILYPLKVSWRWWEWRWFARSFLCPLSLPTTLLYIKQLQPSLHTVCCDSIKMESGKDSSSLPFMVSQVALVVKKVSEVAQLCPLLWDPMDCSLPGSFLNPWKFPGQNTGVGCHFLLQGIFPTLGLNPGLPHCRHTPYHLSYQGSTCLQRRRHETWVRSLGWEDPLEEGMATHSSILAWWVPWTEEPGGL